MAQTLEIPIELVVRLARKEEVDAQYLRRRFLETPPERRADFFREFGGASYWDPEDDSCNTAEGFRQCQTLIRDLSTDSLKDRSAQSLQARIKDAGFIQFDRTVRFMIVADKVLAYLPINFIADALLGLVLIERSAGRRNGICRRCEQLFTRRPGKLFCNMDCAHAHAVASGRQKQLAKRIALAATIIRRVRRPSRRAFWHQDARFKRMIANKMNDHLRVHRQPATITPNWLSFHHAEIQAKLQN